MANRQEATRRQTTARGTLTREIIVTTAISRIEADGADRLTMRAVAADLDCAVMSLYTHVKNRDDLQAAVVAHLITELDIPGVIHASSSNWESVMRATLRAYFDLALRFPRSFALLALAPAEAAHVTEHLDSIVTHLGTLGFSQENARIILDTADAFATGFLIVRAQPSLPRLAHDPAEDLAETAWPAYEAGIEILLAGIRARM
ncbi:TetR/AcrR family transcriptional regulator [Leucobacter sp. cx-328]|uniref:TetR/AcrR family transcriptional regulator n=1 Tax=unclassified Leucobacter TaxID=2621730 RepID=UPI00165E8705|nr:MULTISPECIES: TetR/AcrR family transcriptional regulator [unclassified Leucobacter]MBC9943084.1 TetR/AcrR family transcriptional regulator [Leucobacter sp. cx-328]